MIDVAAERKKRSWSQSVLAEKAGVHVRTLRRIEKGEAVTEIMLDRVAKAMGLHVDRENVEGIDLDTALKHLEDNPAPGTGITRLDGLAVVSLTFCLVWMLFVFKEWGAGPLWIAICWSLPAILLAGLVVSLYVGMRGYSRRSKASLKPYCASVLDGIETGRVRTLDERVAWSLCLVAGDPAFENARNSKQANLTILRIPS